MMKKELLFSSLKKFARAFLVMFLILACAVGGVALAGTPTDSYTTLLIHADGADATTLITDASSFHHAMTANGNAQVDTAQSKFGGGSMLFDGSGDYYSTPDSNDFEMSNGDFTLDLWAYPTSVSGNQGLLVKNYASGYSPFLIFRAATSYQFYAASADGSWDICSATSMGTATINTWSHLAVVRQGNTFTTYQDGVSQGSCTSSGTLANNTNDLAIGIQTSANGATSFTGNIDEVRVSKGIARWTANFTPPSSAYGGTDVTFTEATSVTGDFNVTSSISKGSGTFLIDHPLDPKNKLLYHSFVESPDVKNIYDGVAILDKRGEAKIVLPAYFMALNKDFRYLATPIGEPMPGLYLKKDVSRNRFMISGGTPGGKISWQVTGIRHDPYILANPIVPEVEKTDETIVKKGEYVFEGYGKK